jgi:hypothetical protein
MLKKKKIEALEEMTYDFPEKITDLYTIVTERKYR